MKIEDKVTNFFIQKFIKYLIKNVCKIYFHLKNFAVMAILIESHNQNIHISNSTSTTTATAQLIVSDALNCIKVNLHGNFTAPTKYFKSVGASCIFFLPLSRLVFFYFQFWFLHTVFYAHAAIVRWNIFHCIYVNSLKIIGPGAKSELFTECIWTFWLLFHVLCQYDCDYHFDID